jgi:uncharacterized membrane protein
MKDRRLISVIAIAVFTLLTGSTSLAAQDATAPANKAQHHHYKLIDIGTFGGPESYINPFDTLGSPNQINGRGTAVGGSATSIPTTSVSNFFICGGASGAVPFVNHAFEWQNGVVTDLRSLGRPSNCSVATGINANGEIAGQSEIGIVDPVLGIDELRAVVWKNGSDHKSRNFRRSSQPRHYYQQ